MNLRLWGILVILLVALGGMSWYLSKQQTTPETSTLKQPSEQAIKKLTEPQQPVKLRKATKEPGRVVVLNTTRGKIEFVLYEKDCPKTTTRIAGLVQGGFYDGITFPRVEGWVIQTNLAKREVPPMGVELTEGLTHAKGTVGMARAASPDSNTSVFYITLEPAPHLDSGYTNFGRVIRGMDVAMKIQLNDKIKTATIRPLTAADRLALQELLAPDAQR